MNDNIDLTKILKNCPKGTKLYSPMWGEVYFKKIYSNTNYPIITTKDNYVATFTKEGHHFANAEGECLLFPSKEQRDWNKFSAPWYKKEKFDPKTLKPFDKVLVRISKLWRVNFFSHKEDNAYRCIDYSFKYCIPYNDETKYLVGTSDEAPEYYRYWED